ncbi:MAG: LysE family transporter [Dehalococcoidales bacterium]|nr:MAG: LysE family transporter [Dehalococcoidales bacterium]
MLPILLSVVVISLSGVMMPGPVFAVTVAKSYHSPWVGAKIALGHAVIEVPLILLIYFGFAQFFENATVHLVLSLLGGAVIIWLGFSMFRARAEVVYGGKDLSYNATTAGIITSGLNPSFLLWWATIGLMLIERIDDYGTAGLTALIVVHWSCDLVWLSLVSVLIYKTQTLWAKRFQEGLFIICSLLLAGFGVWFIVSGIQQAV